MKWWYKPCIKETFFEDYDSVLWDIFSFYKNVIGTHNVPNYYIFNDKGLYDLIKGSEIDPLSITRNQSFDEIINNSNLYGVINMSNIQLSDNSFNLNNRIKKVILHRYYEDYNNDVMNEIQNCISKIKQGDNTKMEIKEYKLKNEINHMPVVYISNIYMCIKSNENNIINQIFDLNSTIEKYIFVFTYKKDVIDGFTYFPFNEIALYKNIFKYLLLTSTEYFTVKLLNVTTEESLIIERKIQKVSTLAEVQLIKCSIYGKE